MIIEFDETLSYRAKLLILLKRHNISENFIVDEEDVPMVVMALNQDDINSVEVDDEGGLVIGYSGDGLIKEYE
jgi:DNA-binding LacI/PurR family transcriptional regulator